MAETYEYDETAALESTVNIIHKNWQELYTELKSGKKAFLTQMKNHYTKIIEEDPQAAAELMAINEYTNSLIRKHGFPVSETK